MYHIHTLRRRVFVAEARVCTLARLARAECEAIKDPPRNDTWTPAGHLYLYRYHVHNLHCANRFLRAAKTQLKLAHIECDQVRRAELHNERADAATIARLVMLRTWGVPFVLIPADPKPAAQEVTQ